jgi:hypothetical protein
VRLEDQGEPHARPVGRLGGDVVGVDEGLQGSEL